MKKIMKFLYSIDEENNRILNATILILFIVLSLFIGYYHEPWADEAQSWLIARDASVSEIIFKIARYEGTPVLWQLILKLLITLGLQYKYFYLVSVFFSTIGVWIIVYKLKIPNAFKILLPFSYFILYEYTVKARSYSLLLPVLAGLAWVYENRRSHVILYNFLLGILATICLHGSIVSGVLYIFEIFEVINTIIEDKNIKRYKKEIISIIVLSFLYIFIIFTVYPSSDVYVSITFTSKSKLTIINRILYYVIKFLEIFVLNYNYWKIMILPALIFTSLLFFFILRRNKNKKMFFAIFLPTALFIYFIRLTTHHLGIIFYVFIFAIYLIRYDIAENNKKYLNIMCTIMLIIHAMWSMKSIAAEVKYPYAAGKHVADYLEELDYEELDIYVSGYYATAILPYFENNIFDNDRGGNTYYTWSNKNTDWHYIISESYIYPENTEYRPDIIILHDNYSQEVYDELFGKLQESEEYEEKIFFGKEFFKGNVVNNNGLYVFERID